MANKAFTSDNTNISTETVYTTVPTAFGPKTYSFTRTLQVYKSTSIAKNAHQQQPGSNCICRCPSMIPQRNLIMQGQKHVFPDGISHTFNPTWQPCAIQEFRSTNLPFNQQQFITNNCIPHTMYQPLTLEQEIAHKEFQTMQQVLMQERLRKNAYQLRFHHNQGTSTNDLLQGKSQIPLSQGMPDVNNVCCTIAGLKIAWQSMCVPNYNPPNSLYSPVSTHSTYGKKLFLTKTPDLKKQASTLPPLEQKKPERKKSKTICQKSKSKNKSGKEGNCKQKQKKKPKRQPKKRKTCFFGHHSSDNESYSSDNDSDWSCSSDNDTN